MLTEVNGALVLALSGQLSKFTGVVHSVIKLVNLIVIFAKLVQLFAQNIRPHLTGIISRLTHGITKGAV